MKTIADLLKHCTEAEKDGKPAVKNWPQAKAAFMLFELAGPLNSLLISEFDDRFPNEPEGLHPNLERASVSRQTYRNARREVSRVIGLVTGISADPWDPLLGYVRSNLGIVKENALYAIRTEARAASLKPNELTPEWARSVDARLGVGTARNSFRRGWALLDDLRQSDAVPASLLPPCPLGPLPKYDGLGRNFIELPPKLAAIGATHPRLKLIWNAARHAGIFDAEADPDPSDLLDRDTWDAIVGLGPAQHGVKPSNWNAYLSATGQLLEAHSELRRPPRGHVRLKWDVADNQAERRGLKAMEAQVSALGEPFTGMAPIELLHIQNWRRIWGSTSEQRVPEKFKAFEIDARRALFRATDGASDPLLLLEANWSRLPDIIKKHLMPAKFAALRAMLLPNEVTEGFIRSEIPVGPLQDAAIKVVQNFDQLMAEAARLLGSSEDPVQLAWDELRSSARGRGFDTNRLGCVAARAIADKLKPSEVSPEWTSKVAACLSSIDRAKFSAELRNIDAMREDAHLSSLLPRAALSNLEDHRKKGNADLPDPVMLELRQYVEAYGFSHNTFRSLRSSVTKIYTAGLQAGLIALPCSLADILVAAPVVTVEGRPKRDAAAMLERLRISDFEMLRQPPVR